MLKDYKISEPFFEFGPKCYMYGDKLESIAKGFEKLAVKYGINVIVIGNGTASRGSAVRRASGRIVPAPVRQRTGRSVQRWGKCLCCSATAPRPASRGPHTPPPSSPAARGAWPPHVGPTRGVPSR